MIQEYSESQANRDMFPGDHDVSKCTFIIQLYLLIRFLSHFISIHVVFFIFRFNTFICQTFIKPEIVVMIKITLS